MDIVINILMFLLGSVSSFVIFHFQRKHREVDGIMLINRQDPEFATCGFKFNKDVKTLLKCREIVLEVKTENSQS